jgi:hypothetical protein
MYCDGWHALFSRQCIRDLHQNMLPTPVAAHLIASLLADQAKKPHIVERQKCDQDSRHRQGAAAF